MTLSASMGVWMFCSFKILGRGNSYRNIKLKFGYCSHSILSFICICICIISALHWFSWNCLTESRSSIVCGWTESGSITHLVWCVSRRDVMWWWLASFFFNRFGWQEGGTRWKQQDVWLLEGLCVPVVQRPHQWTDTECVNSSLHL